MAITLQDLLTGCRAYWANEPRDAMYRIASQLVEQNRGNAAEMADGLGVVLLTWNQAAYRYAPFEFARLESFLDEERDALEAFRERSIAMFDPLRDREAVLSIFSTMLSALRATNGRLSPVAVAKGLHVLAPDFFPIWDRKIADGLECMWEDSDAAGVNYLALMDLVRVETDALEAAYARRHGAEGFPDAPTLAESLSAIAGRSKKLLKFLDEYYYAKYTGRWIA
jgi:hypothetical protein